MSIPARILRDLKALPTLPKAALELNRILADEDTSASDVAKVVETDPALTVNLLKVVNSAAVGLSREISSVRQAATLLGNRGVQRVVSVAIVGHVLPEVLPGYGLQTQEIWAHCAATAVFSERLARRRDEVAPDIAFTAGLLHDVGKLAVGAALEEVREDVIRDLQDGSLQMIEQERRALGTDHTEVGGLLAQRWSLPASIAQSVRHHHEPSGADLKHQSLVQVVHIANGLAHVLGLGADVGEMHRTILPEVLEAQELDADALQHFMGETMDAVLTLIAELPGRS